jgi:hypothetical protein
VVTATAIAATLAACATPATTGAVASMAAYCAAATEAERALIRERLDARYAPYRVRVECP